MKKSEIWFHKKSLNKVKIISLNMPEQDWIQYEDYPDNFNMSYCEPRTVFLKQFKRSK